MKRKIEIFTAGCPLCDPVVKMVKELVCENYDVAIYDMVTQCYSKTCLDQAKAYGVVQFRLQLQERIKSPCYAGKEGECF